jgi:hypothetical protein
MSTPPENFEQDRHRSNFETRLYNTLSYAENKILSTENSLILDATIEDKTNELKNSRSDENIYTLYSEMAQTVGREIFGKLFLEAFKKYVDYGFLRNHDSPRKICQNVVSQLFPKGFEISIDQGVGRLYNDFAESTDSQHLEPAITQMLTNLNDLVWVRDKVFLPIIQTIGANTFSNILDISLTPKTKMN